MAVSLRSPVLLLLVGLTAGVTPVEKVITLLEDLKTEVTNDGTAEATSYGKFACFCKTNTDTRSTSITTGKDTIDTLSADIEDKTARKVDDMSKLAGRTTDQEGHAADLHASNMLEAKQKGEYDATNADLTKAIGGLTGAIQAMKDSKSFLQTDVDAVSKSLALADAMGLITAPKREAVSAFLQKGGSRVDPSDADYKYHSSGIIDTLEKLKTEFVAEKSDVDTEWAKTKTNLDATQSSLTTQMNTNKLAMTALETNIQLLKTGIATDREDLVGEESDLKDDQLYLKDLTARCEERANDFDQRSQMRAGEITALTAALGVLNNKVSSNDDVLKRAMLVQRAPVAPADASVKAVSAEPKAANTSRIAKSAPSFLQVRSSTEQVQKDKVIALLRKEGRRLSSTSLAMLAMHVAADPFGKVKDLVQKLIERLVQEATEEATKKGFCDAELGKANQDRDARMGDTVKINAELASLEAKRDDLETEISTLTTEISDLETALRTADTDRASEKANNTHVISESKAGLAAVRDAITILKVFYKHSAKASSLVQWSPVDEDTTGAGFAGSYSGKQAASSGILGLLAVIETDFDRSVRTTTEAEARAAAEFVEFDRVSNMDIASKSTKKKLDQDDLKTTKDRQAQKMNDLQEAVDMVDSALERLQELKPTCIDTGMSYADRVAKRNEEIAALNKAHCLLSPGKGESDCDASYSIP